MDEGILLSYLQSRLYHAAEVPCMFLFLTVLLSEKRKVSKALETSRL